MNTAGYHGIRRSEAIGRVEHYLDLLDLWGKRKAMARTLSGGMKRRLMIARALVHDPGLLILDEPTAGVDIEIRRSMWEFLEKINNEGKTIILTTHYLEEAESLCRNVAIIDHGDVIEQGSVARLLSQSLTQSFVFDLENPESLTIPSHLTGSRPQGEKTVLSLGADGQLDAVLPKGVPLDDVFDVLRKQQITVNSMRAKSNRLETFFLQLLESTDKSSSQAGGDSVELEH